MARCVFKSPNAVLCVRSTARTVILIPQRQEGEKTTGGGISEFSLSQSSWKAKRWGGWEDREGRRMGRELALTTEPSRREWELYIMAR